MKLEQAARQALEALEDIGGFEGWTEVKNKAITALREALAEQAEQEPVACIIHTEEGDYVDWNSKGYCFYIGETPLYAAPVRTKDLTDDDLRVCFKATNTSEPLAEGWPGLERFARAVIAADREKNK